MSDPVALPNFTDLVAAANEHGNEGGTVAELSDHIALFDAAYSLLTPEQLRAFWVSDLVTQTLETPEFEKIQAQVTTYFEQNP